MEKEKQKYFEQKIIYEEMKEILVDFKTKENKDAS